MSRKINSKILTATVLCIMCAFLLTAGCTVTSTTGAGSGENPEASVTPVADYDEESSDTTFDLSWMDEKTTYDLEGNYSAPDNVDLTYKIKFDDITNSNEVMLYKQTIKSYSVSMVEFSGTMSMSGTDRVITLINGDVYTLSDSNVLTTPEGYSVQMVKTA